MEQVNAGESWNKKKIFIAVFLLIILAVGGYFFKTRILADNSPTLDQKYVKGTSTQEEAVEPVLRPNIQEAVKEKIDNLKREVSNLNIIEIASSSPQVQKILNDIKSLEQYPVNQAKEVCKKLVENFCGL